jgi:TRAP-type C4-dicarboxylate transport system permease small subunit
MLAIRSFRKVSLRVLEWSVIALMAILVADVTWQVTTRYLLGSPSAWTDELATILMIWVAALGASLGFVQHAHLGIDYFVRLLPPEKNRWIQMGVQIIIGGFAGVILLYGGIKLVQLTMTTDQRSPALGLNMGIVYLAIPISGFFILLSVAEEIWQLTRPPILKTDENPIPIQESQ